MLCYFLGFKISLMKNSEVFCGLLLKCPRAPLLQHLYTERNHPQGKVVWIVMNCS